jgi:hypothetical protein
MAPPREAEPALAAPGIGAARSIVDPPVSGPRSSRRSRNRPYRHVHLELDLAPPTGEAKGEPLLERLEGFLREREVVEAGTLIRLAAGTLHALAAQRFRRVDHWEISPGGWLPPPRPGKDRDDSEPVGELLETLEGGAWPTVASARSFSARLSDLGGQRVDVTVRRVHRERRHSLSLDLWGSWTKSTVSDLEGSLSSRLSVAKSTMTKYEYA